MLVQSKYLDRVQITERSLDINMINVVVALRASEIVQLTRT